MRTVTIGWKIVLVLVSACGPALAQAKAPRKTTFLGMWSIRLMVDQACTNIARRYNLNEQQEAYTRAYQLRDRLTDRERLQVTANYFKDVMQDQRQDATVLRALLDQYPDDEIAANNLAGLYLSLRQYEEAAELYERQIQADSSGD